MSSDSTATQEVSESQPDFRVTMMYHPSHHCDRPRRGRAVLRRGLRTPEHIAGLDDAPGAPGDGYPTDYSTFTPINDVLFDTIHPKPYVLLGVQRYKTVEQPHLKGFGWYVEGMAELYRALRRQGLQIVTQLDEIAEGDETPTAPARRCRCSSPSRRTRGCATSSSRRPRASAFHGSSRRSWCRVIRGCR